MLKHIAFTKSSILDNNKIYSSYLSAALRILANFAKNFKQIELRMKCDYFYGFSELEN